MEAGHYPADWCEVLSPEERQEETIMLQLRVAEGLPETVLNWQQREVAEQAVEDGLAKWKGEPRALVLTRRGRLLADGIVTNLLVA